ncbi:DUF4350 domain-containing protein [Gordonia sp. NPDC003429]
MSAPVAPPPSAPGGARWAAPRVGPPSRRRWVRWVVGVLAALVVVALLGILLVFAAPTGSHRPMNAVPYDPANAGPAGTRALARVIDQHGAQVNVARGLDALREQPEPTADTTVVVTRPNDLSDDTARDLLDRVRDAHRLVLINPSAFVLARLDLPVTEARGSTASSARAGCRTDGIAPTDVISNDVNGYVALDSVSTSCFLTTGYPDEPPGANVVFSPRTAERPEVVVMTGASVLNQNLARYDNAGVAIRVIAETPAVLWYQPQIRDQVPARKKPGPPSDVPNWIGPLVLLSFFALLALMFWRGRRFGPVVGEPLPVVVKAIETTESRGRMYHRAGADARAASILRIRTLSRLARYFGLPYDPGRALDALDVSDDDTAGLPDDADPALRAIISATAAAAHRDPREVHALLAGPLPSGDADLLAFSDELSALDQKVRRTP